MTRTGIIAPMPSEAAHLVPPGTPPTGQTGNGSPLYQWETGSSQVFLVCSGIGMRKAAQAANHLIRQCSVDRVIVCGVAGGLVPGCRAAEVVLPQEVRAYTYVARGGFITQGPIESEHVGPAYPVDTGLRKAALSSCPSEPAGGTLVTVHGLVTSVPLLQWFHQGLLATAVDMESASVAAVCDDAGVPFLVVRAFSDNATEVAGWGWPGLVNARKRGRLVKTGYYLRHPLLAARFWSVQRDVDRGARAAAQVVKDML